MTTKELRQFAASISNNLEYRTKDNGDTFVVFKDNERAQELRDWFIGVSGEYTDHNFNELNEAYVVLNTLCDIIDDNTNGDEEDEDLDAIEEAICEYSWAYDSNHDLLMWVDESLSRMGEVDEAIQEGATTLDSAIQSAMDRTRSDMAISFMNSMSEGVEL